MELKSPREVEKLRVSNRIVAQVLRRVAEAAAPGVTTRELDDLAESLIRQTGAEPAFKGYPKGPNPFPACLCTSVNEQVVHGVPSNRRLREGDIISLDVGVRVDGYYGDCAVTVPVGRVSEEAGRLLSTTREVLEEGIRHAVAGGYLRDISHAIQTLAEGRGYSVVRKYTGHGIGRSLHEEPQVPNFGSPGWGPRLREGMALAIEPMLNVGGPDVKELEDQWTVVTADGSLSAHFEHIIVVTEDGAEVLTRGVDPTEGEDAQGRGD
ncbi:MAG: type I methionyl aminopeptidase [Candidatus Tectomicrobia bacterium]|nr:type I methionyl aminopeptidase [Candidatus Tectomicrobia bacterium]